MFFVVQKKGQAITRIIKNISGTVHHSRNLCQMGVVMGCVNSVVQKKGQATNRIVKVALEISNTYEIVVKGECVSGNGMCVFCSTEGSSYH